MRTKFLYLMLTIAIAFVSGCGGGGGGSASVENTIADQTTNATIYDLGMNKGSGSLTLAANGQIDSLIAIPYNTSLTSGSFSTNVAITADSQPLSIIPVTSKNQLATNSNSCDATFQQKILKQQLKLLNLPIKGNRQTTRSLKSNYTSYDDSSSLSFYKEGVENPVPATKKYKGTRCLIYIDNNLLQSSTPDHLIDSRITELGQAFDNFYSTMNTYFGSPSSALDAELASTYNFTKNEMIYIFISELEHNASGWVGGYFDGTNELPNTFSNTTRSNQKKMLYITSYNPKSTTDEWISTIKGTMAHEFQHLIYCNHRLLKYNSDNDVYSELWINEGLAMVAEDIAIKGAGSHNSDLDDRIEAYLTDSTGNSLCTWGSTVADYAPAYMFMRYFADRFTEGKIKDLINSSSMGTAMLTNMANGASFTQLFRDWLTAVIFDRQNFTFTDSTFTNKYLYDTLNLASFTGIALGVQGTGSLTMPDSTGGYIIRTGLTGKQSIIVSIQGNSNFGLRVIAVPKN